MWNTIFAHVRVRPVKSLVHKWDLEARGYLARIAARNYLCTGINMLDPLTTLQHVHVHCVYDTRVYVHVHDN